MPNFYLWLLLLDVITDDFGILYILLYSDFN